MANLYQTALMDRLDPQAQGLGRVSTPGYQAPVDPQTPIEGPSPAPAPAAPRQTFAMGGFDPGKLANAGHTTEKYQLGRVLQYHDPSKGITPELLAELNGLNIGDFSGQGDRLSVKNARNGARWTDGTGDIIKNFTGEGPKEWGALDTAPAQAAPAAQGMGLPQAMSPLKAANPDQYGYGVQGILDQYTQQSPYLAALLQQLGGMA